mgnify:CR=1 FL=1
MYNIHVNGYNFMNQTSILRHTIQKDIFFWINQPTICLYQTTDNKLYCLNHSHECELLEELLSPMDITTCNINTCDQSQLLDLVVKKNSNNIIELHFYRWRTDVKYPDHITYIKHIVNSDKIDIDDIQVTIQEEPVL